VCSQNWRLVAKSSTASTATVRTSRRFQIWRGNWARLSPPSNSSVTPKAMCSIRPPKVEFEVERPNGSSMRSFASSAITQEELGMLLTYWGSMSYVSIRH
jgi:hypothetical protein